MFQAFFRANGIPCIIADPREAEYDGKKLTFGGEPINFVYKRVITGELLAKRNEAKPLLAAYRDRAACFANSFRSRLADNKVIFALLSDPELADRFSAEERAVAAACIPWTRRVAQGRTRVGNDVVDLVEYLRTHREELVMKPNTDYGGRNVAIGTETPQGEWESVIDKALAGDWVVQKRVTIPEEQFPVVSGTGLTFEPRKVNINPFALGGSYGGCVSRLSTQSIINVRRRRRRNPPVRRRQLNPSRPFPDPHGGPVLMQPTVLVYSSHERCNYIHNDWIVQRALRGNHRILFLPLSASTDDADSLHHQEYNWERFSYFFDFYKQYGLDAFPFFLREGLQQADVSKLWEALGTAEVVILGGGRPRNGHAPVPRARRAVLPATATSSSAFCSTAGRMGFLRSDSRRA